MTKYCTSFLVGSQCRACTHREVTYHMQQSPCGPCGPCTSTFQLLQPGDRLLQYRTGRVRDHPALNALSRPLQQPSINFDRALPKDLSIPQLRRAFWRVAISRDVGGISHPQSCLPQTTLKADDHRTRLRREKACDVAC